MPFISNSLTKNLLYLLAIFSIVPVSLKPMEKFNTQKTNERYRISATLSIPIRQQTHQTPVPTLHNRTNANTPSIYDRPQLTSSAILRHTSQRANQEHKANKSPDITPFGSFGPSGSTSILRPPTLAKNGPLYAKNLNPVSEIDSYLTENKAENKAENKNETSSMISDELRTKILNLPKTKTDQVFICQGSLNIYNKNLTFRATGSSPEEVVSHVNDIYSKVVLPAFTSKEQTSTPVEIIVHTNYIDTKVSKQTGTAGTEKQVNNQTGIISNEIIYIDEKPYRARHVNYSHLEKDEFLFSIAEPIDPKTSSDSQSEKPTDRQPEISLKKDKEHKLTISITEFTKPTKPKTDLDISYRISTNPHIEPRINSSAQDYFDDINDDARIREYKQNEEIVQLMIMMTNINEPFEIYRLTQPNMSEAWSNYYKASRIIAQQDIGEILKLKDEDFIKEFKNLISGELPSTYAQSKNDIYKSELTRELRNNKAKFEQMLINKYKSSFRTGALSYLPSLLQRPFTQVLTKDSFELLKQHYNTIVDTHQDKEWFAESINKKDNYKKLTAMHKRYLEDKVYSNIMGSEIYNNISNCISILAWPVAADIMAQNYDKNINTEDLELLKTCYESLKNNNSKAPMTLSGAIKEKFSPQSSNPEQDKSLFLKRIEGFLLDQQVGYNYDIAVQNGLPPQLIPYLKEYGVKSYFFNQTFAEPEYAAIQEEVFKLVKEFGPVIEKSEAGQDKMIEPCIVSIKSIAEMAGECKKQDIEDIVFEIEACKELFDSIKNICGHALRAAFPNPIDVLTGAAHLAKFIGSNLLRCTTGLSEEESMVMMLFPENENYSKHIQERVQHNGALTCAELGLLANGISEGYKQLKANPQDTAETITGEVIGSFLIFPKVLNCISWLGKIVIKETQLIPKLKNLKIEEWIKFTKEDKLALAAEAPASAFTLEIAEEALIADQQLARRAKACVFLEGYCAENNMMHVFEAVQDPLLTKTQMAERIRNICAIQPDPELVLKFLHEMKEANAYLGKLPPVIIKEISDKPLKLSIDHVFGIDELKLTPSGFKWKGGHYDFGNRLQQGDLLKFANKTELGLGTFDANVTIFGKTYPKTYFNPQNTIVQNIDELFEALNNANKTVTLVEGGTLEISAQSSKGTFFKYYVDPRQGNISSAYVDRNLMKEKYINNLNK